MPLFGSSRRSTTSTNTTYNDNRSVIDAGGGVVGSGNVVDASNDYAFTDNSLQLTDARQAYSYASDSRDQSFSDSRDQSFSLADNSSRYNYASDSSNRSVTNISGTDPGLARIAETNAQLLGAVAESQSDAVRFTASMGADTLRNLGESFTDLYATGTDRQARAWESTVQASSRVIDGLLSATAAQSDGARALAQSAMSAYQPSESKAGDALKWAVIAGAALLALRLLKA